MSDFSIIGVSMPVFSFFSTWTFFLVTLTNQTSGGPVHSSPFYYCHHSIFTHFPFNSQHFFYALNQSSYTQTSFFRATKQGLALYLPFSSALGSNAVILQTPVSGLRTCCLPAWPSSWYELGPCVWTVCVCACTRARGVCIYEPKTPSS